MLISLEQFVAALSESGILSLDEFSAFLDELRPGTDVLDAESLARHLVERQRLTIFQALEIFKGKGSHLIFDDYVLLDVLGIGGMGAVYKARRRRDGVIVALKTLPGILGEDKPFVRRFQREVAACTRLCHPNIVRICDAGYANGLPFLVTEYVPGDRLDLLVKRFGPLSVADSLNYIRQTAVGLEYAHSQGVIHRDVKPSNLLIDSQGTIRILDLGLARLLPAPEAEATDPVSIIRLTQQGQILGTPHYMSPEQARDARAADARSDVYALGCTWHFLLTGKPPYGGDTVVEKLMAHRDEPIPSLRARRPEVPESLDLVFQVFLAKRPAERYQSMAEVIAALDDCLLLWDADLEAPLNDGSSADASTADGSQLIFTPEEHAAWTSRDTVTLAGPRSDETVSGAAPSPAAVELPGNPQVKRPRRQSPVVMAMLGVMALLLIVAAIYRWLMP
jgi:serine/threonine protein kinase